MKLLRSALKLNVKPLLLVIQLVLVQRKAKILVVITCSLALAITVRQTMTLQAPMALKVVRLHQVVVMVAVVIDCQLKVFLKALFGLSLFVYF